MAYKQVDHIPTAKGFVKREVSPEGAELRDFLLAGRYEAGDNFQLATVANGKVGNYARILSPKSRTGKMVGAVLAARGLTAAVTSTRGDGPNGTRTVYLAIRSAR